ncbi:hypothetical protein JXB02_01035 [Candidatus Woesearchaeota archaeon]|nr:hypothetical protein [Candidatus Woesearchaeota archaeon]
MEALLPRILVFGNPHLPEDSLAVRVARLLEGKVPYRFVECGSVECVIDYPDYAYILDVAYGIGSVQIIDDPDRLRSSPLYSLHDFDLAFFLKLLRATGPDSPSRIIALPMGLGPEQAADRVKRILEKGKEREKREE